MKKVLSLTLIAGLSSSLLAAGNYGEISYNSITLDDHNILGVQPQAEFVGNYSGVKVSLGRIADVGTFADGSKAGIYISSGKSGNSSDMGIGVDFKLKLSKFNIGIVQPYFGGGVGVGRLDDKGIRRDVSTQVNVANYVTTGDLNTLKTPTKAYMDDYSSYVENYFVLGLDFVVSDKTMIHTGYKYNSKHYQLKYRLHSSIEVLNTITTTARYTGFQAGISHRF